MGILVSEDLNSITQLFVKNESDRISISDEATEVLDSLKTILTYEHQRRSINTGLGVWFCIKKENGYYLSKLYILKSFSLCIY